MFERIKEGFMVFVSDAQQGVGSVRQVTPDKRPELVIYIENAGDFVVPLSAIESVHSDKVVLHGDQIEPALREAIRHAHDAEPQGDVSSGLMPDDQDQTKPRQA